MMGSMLRRGSLGDGSTLSLDFTTGVLDPRLSFTRASTATYINSQGYVATMAAAPTNDPTKARFDHDPTTLAPRGLLIEGAATNLLNWSESFNSSGGSNNNWNDSAIARTTGQTDPANGTTAILFTASAGSATVISSAAIGTSAARTFSVWLRRVTGTGDIQYTQNAGTNWTTQAITSTWTRYQFTHTFDHRVGIRIVTSGDAIEMWGAQLETGSGASSYIPTGASQATRVADECSMTPTNFSSWFTNNSEGSFLVRYSMNNPSAFLGAGIDRYAYEISNSSGTSRVFCNASYRVTVAGDAGRFPRVFDLGTIDLAPSLVATAAQNTALAWGYKSNDNHLAAVGVTANDTSGSLQTGLDRMHLGASRTFGSTTYLQGCISQLKYWPTRIPNATLQGLVS
jgi:hypothetical protein